MVVIGDVCIRYDAARRFEPFSAQKIFDCSERRTNGFWKSSETIDSPIALQMR